MALPNPVIFVPGITGNYLRDEYTLPPEIVWSVPTKKYERAALHPDDPRYEAREPAWVVSDQLYEIVYEEVIEELRSELTDRPDSPVPVYPFSYDWRMPLDQIEMQLADFVEEVIDRTRLMRHYHSTFKQSPKVNLIGHSMGGLIIAGYLDSHGRGGTVGKVVTLASPFQGSLEPVVKVTTGTANLGAWPPSARERKAARMTPSLYHLLPSFSGAVQAPPDFPQSLFEVGLWQSSILGTIADYVRDHGVSAGTKSSRAQQAREILSGFLSAAKAHRDRVSKLDLSGAGLGSEDWLCIIGVDAVTRVRLKVARRNRKPEFMFQRDDRKNQWDDKDASPEERKLTGDETVPFEGAVPAFLPYNSLICVTPDDYGLWEFGDRIKNWMGGFHGTLPNMNLVRRLIVRHLASRSNRHGETWAWPPPGIGYGDWDPPLNKLRKRKTD